jgi:hypothetical protein
MIYELIGYNTDTKQIRYRSFTKSKKKAELFNKIPKIVFLKMNHGIVFYSKPSTIKGHPILIEYGDYVDAKMNRLKNDE